MIKQRVDSSFPTLYNKWGKLQKIDEKDFIEFSKVFPYCECNKYPRSGPNKNTQLLIGLKDDSNDFGYSIYRTAKYEDGYWRLFTLKNPRGDYYFILLNACDKERLLPTETAIFRRDKSLDSTLQNSTGNNYLSSIVFEEEEYESEGIIKFPILTKVIPAFENPEEIKDYLLNVYHKSLNDKYEYIKNHQ